MAEMRKIANFELLERIGQGGMGTVFKARQISMDRIIALKVLPPSMARQKKFIERFVREARASARLNHPNIVNGIDVGHDNGLYYFAMEYVEGENLKDTITKGRISEERVIDIARAIARALAHAHANGILHRDIKPDNILIDKHQTPKLCDLGLARLDNDTENEKQLTQQGQAVGTPHYISPEQARGESNLDAKTDLYSLGATMYHLVTGETPFDGATSILVMTRHITDKCKHPNEHGVQLSKGMVAVLAKLLTKDRNDRYESAEQLANDLDRMEQGKAPAHADLPASKWPFLTGAPSPAAAPKKGTAVSGLEKQRTTRRDTRSSSQNKGKLAAPLLLVGIAAVALVIYFGRANSPQPVSPETNAVAESPKDPVPQPTPPVQISKPPAPVKIETKPANFTRVAPTADAVGFRKPENPTPRVAPQNQSVGFRQPTVATSSSDSGSGSEKTATSPDKKTLDPASMGTKPLAVPEIKVPPPEKIAPGHDVAALIAKALPLANECKYHEAAALFALSESKLKALDEFDRDMVSIHADAFAGLIDMKTTVLDHLKNDVNKLDASKVTKKMAGTLAGGALVGGDEAKLSIKGPGFEIQYDWHKLTLDELNTLCTLTMGGVIPAEISLGMGVVSFDRGDDIGARKFLGGVPHPNAKRLLEMIDLRDKALIAKKVAEKNAQAEKLYAEVETAMAEPNYQAAVNKIAVLKSIYADTEKVKSSAAELDSSLELAKLAAGSGAVIANGNVALASNDATITGATNGAVVIDGVVTGYTLSEGYGSVSPGGDFTITLAKTYLLREIRVLLWDGDTDRFYRFAVDVSADGKDFASVADHSRGRWRSWQTIKFPARPVKAIKFHGVGNSNSANASVHVVELEAYCKPPEKDAVPKAPSSPPGSN